MKRFVLFFAPIILGFLAFLGFVFVSSKFTIGNGALQVTAVPVSEVYLNGKKVGKTPLCLCEGKDQIPSGTYSLRLVPLAGDNLTSYEDTITVTKGILTVVDRTFGVGEFSSGSVITLSPITDTKTAELFIASVPSGATVTMDGNVVGVTPLLLKSVTASDHDLELSENGYESKTAHIHTVAGYKLNTAITLGIAQATATPSAALQNASLTPTVGVKVVILDTPTGFLRVHADPSIAASETAQVKPGDSFPYVDEQDGWYEIQLSDGSNGWVSTQYANKQ